MSGMAECCSSCKGRGGRWLRWCYMGVLGRDFYLCQRCQGTGLKDGERDG